MNGLGGLNKSRSGVVIGLVQLQLPVIETRADVARQAEKIVAMVAKARRGMAGMDLVVFPEYALHGLSMDTRPEILCTLDGPEVTSFRAACRDNRIWGCFSIMELNPDGNPYNSGLVVDDAGAIRLCPYSYMQDLAAGRYRLPWEAGVEVRDGTSCGFPVPNRVHGGSAS